MLGPRRLLTLDSFAAHKTPDVLKKYKELDLDVAMIPGGYTPVLQPLDIGVNKSFKDKFCEYWSYWKHNQYYQYGRFGKDVKRASYVEVCRWICNACNEVKTL